VSDGPDLTVLAGYVRNKLQAGQAATIIVKGRRVFIVPHTVLGGELPGVLVASEKGESLWVDPNTPLNWHMFVAGGFSLPRARIVAKTFSAIRGTSKKRKQGMLDAKT
jgi:hypothetical protein